MSQNLSPLLLQICWDFSESRLSVLSLLTTARAFSKRAALTLTLLSDIREGSQLTFRRIDKPPASESESQPKQSTLRITLTEKLSGKQQYTVYRGSMTSDGEESSLSVVCKLSSFLIEEDVVDNAGFDDPDELAIQTLGLRREASVYINFLHEHQGRYIPKFYGLFGATVSTTTGPSLRGECIVTQYCGKSLPWNQNIVQQSEHFRRDLMNALVEIHKSGIQLCNVKPEHILKFDEQPFFVSFRFARKRVCPAKLELMEHYFDPLANFKCDELYQMGISTARWKLRTIKYFGKYISIQHASSPGALAKYAPELFTEAYALGMAKVVIQKQRELYYPETKDDKDFVGFSIPDTALKELTDYRHDSSKAGDS